MSCPRLRDLLNLLDRHVPLDEREAEHVARCVNLARSGLEARLDPFSRRCFEPGHFTASSFVLSPDASAVLLILHAKLGFWMQPGGHVDPEDADILTAARREVLEETGLRDVRLLGPISLLDVDVHPIPAHAAEPAHEHFDIRFLFRSPERALIDSDEVLGARWVPLPEVEAIRSDASVTRAVSRIRLRAV